MNFNLFYEINKRDLLQDDIWLTKHIQKGKDAFRKGNEIMDNMFMFNNNL